MRQSPAGINRFIGLARRLWAVVALIALPCFLPAPAAARQSSPELAIKAAYIYNFTKFVSWPPQTFPKPTTPIRICVSDDPAMITALNSTIADKQVDGRPLQITPLHEPKDATVCQVLFLNRLTADQKKQFLANSKGKPVLTVGDEKGFAMQGGIINFFVADDRVRFEVNPDAAEKAGLVISSRLLSLARVVKGKQP